MSAGGTATYTFAVTPTTPTILAPVALAVAGLPASATFVFSPATVATGSGTTAVTLTVVAPAQTGAMHGTSNPHPGSFVMALGLLVLPWGALWSTRQKPQRENAVRAVCDDSRGSSLLVPAKRVWRPPHDPDTERAELQPHGDGKQRRLAAFRNSGADGPVIFGFRVGRGFIPGANAM